MKLAFKFIETENLRVPDLRIDFKEGMNFLQMPNGTGKTTFLDLIRNTLSNNWENLDKKEIKDFKRKHSQEEDGKFTLGLNFNGNNVTFETTFNFIDGTFDVSTMGGSAAAQMVRRFRAPPDLKPYLTKNHVEIFNFSSQIVNDHFDKEKSGVKDAVGTFSGRHKLNELFSRVEQKFKAKHTGNRSTTATTLEKKLTALDTLKEELIGHRKGLKNDLEPMVKEHKEIANKAEKNADARKERDKKILELEANIEELNQKAIDCEGPIKNHLIFPNNLSNDFDKKLKLLYESLEKRKLPGIHTGFFDEISEDPECICGTKMTAKMKKHIKESKKNYLGTHDVVFVNSLKAALKESDRHQGLDETRIDLDKLDDIREQIKDKVTKIEEVEDKFRDKTLTKEEVDHYDTLGDKIAEIKTDLKKLEESKFHDDKNHQQKKKNLESLNASQISTHIKNLPDLKWLDDFLREKHAAADGYQKALKNLNAFKECMDKALISAEKKIKEKLKDDINKMISKIHTGGEDFVVSEIDDHIKLDGQDMGSGAQNVITVTSFALALLKRSEVDFPMMIDHPVKDVQEEDRGELAKFLKETSHQCICLVINTEKDGFIRDDDTRELHSFLQNSNFITATRKYKNVPEAPEAAYVSGNGIVTTDYEYFSRFRLIKEIKEK